MAAPVRYVSGPMMVRASEDGRHVGPRYPVMLVRVGTSEKLREVLLDEQELILLVTRSADVLELLRRDEA